MINALLLDYIQQGATIITPNNRLATEVQTLFFQSQQDAVIEKPRCMPYQSFLHDAWKTHCRHYPTIHFPLLLNSRQTSYLWRQIIIANDEAVNYGLINEIHDAWSRCQRFQININADDFTLTPQTKKFQEWSQEFQHRLDNIPAITDDQLVNAFITQHISLRDETIIWYCFDDYTPQQLVLQNYLQQQGKMIKHLDLPKHTSNAPPIQHLFEAEDEEEEYQQLMAWIKQGISQGHQRIGIVVPDLNRQAPSLQRLLQQELTDISFNISAGLPLGSHSLVSHALVWLGFNNKTLTNHDARLLLYSPWIGYAKSELSMRAELLQHSLVLQEETIEQRVFISELNTSAPQLALLLKSLTLYPKKASIKEWIILFIERLRVLGFPGEYPLDSANYQCYQRFLLLFDELSELALISPILTRSQALSALETLAQTTVFQPKSIGNPPVQILGLLEASGCLFDRLWVTRMTDECLPQKIKPSAFIPNALQRDNSMPHASPERELHLATTILQRFKQSSTDCVFSYPRLSKDKPNLVCPLLIDLPAFKPSAISVLPHLSKLDYFKETYQYPFMSNETKAGGTALLANQAKCPFRAFAAHRLHIKKAITTSDGPNPAERGKIIHKIMEIIWQALGSQSTLLAMPINELDTLINDAIYSALKPYGYSRQHSFPALVQEVEQKRLRCLVEACLKWEKSRPNFTIVALEQAFRCVIGGITFNVRVDRLDKVADNKTWVIDYKSSLPKSLPWKEERPAEPQLLLYALLDDSINTLVFTGLKEGDVINKGFSDTQWELAGIVAIKQDEQWANYRKDWQTRINDLADEYSQGYCPPQPLSPSTCQQCDFQALCRFKVNASG